MAESVATFGGEAVPKAVGLAPDVLAPARASIKATGLTSAIGLETAAGALEVVEAGMEFAKEAASGAAEIGIDTISAFQERSVEFRKLNELIRKVYGKQLEIYSRVEATRQASGRYQAAIAKGARLLAERTAFRQKTAEKTSNYRYKDMAFRIFRNDALQKYRAQFDLASMYAYLAAKTYGYETNLLHFDSRSGEPLLNRIMRERTLGRFEGAVPQTGPGLAGVLAELNGNFQAIKGALGFNNPTVTTDKFSLRREHFRIHPESATGEAVWRETLRRCRVDDLKSAEEQFNRYCNPFDPYNEVKGEPGIVIPFSTTIQADRNFFGWPGSTDGGESFYPSDHFSIKIRGVGNWFSNYQDNSGGLSTTPRCYLVPVGSDVIRVPGCADLSAAQKSRNGTLSIRSTASLRIGRRGIQPALNGGCREPIARHAVGSRGSEVRFDSRLLRRR